MVKDATLTIDRAEGTSAGQPASGNPSAVVYSIDSSYLDRIEALKGRGFSDAETAESGHLVQRITESHLEPYLSIIEGRGKDYPPSVKAAHDLLTFDRRFQSVLFKYMGVLEMQMRAQYSHWMEKAHGAFSLYDSTQFLREDNHLKSLKHLDDEILRKVRRSRGLKRVYEQSGNRLPIAKAVECATLGTLVQLFSNTKDADVTSRVCESFACRKSELSSWMKTLTDVRNICAHFDCYAARKQIPSTPRRIRGLDGADNTKTSYIVLVILRLIASNAPFKDRNLDYAFRMMTDMRALTGDYGGMYRDLLRIIGFPDDWDDCMMTASRLGAER